MTYKYLDKMLTYTVKQIYEIFRKYRKMDFDELNIISQTFDLYAELKDLNWRVFNDIAHHYYESEPHGAEELLWLFLQERLEEINKTIKYSYNTEVIRKRDRLAEALIATKGDKQEYDNAMRYWTQMTGWFGIEIADAALKQARIDDGVKRVMWVSEQDNRVCGVCDDLDGRIFPIREVPAKPHPGCRCHLERVRDAEDE